MHHLWLPEEMQAIPEHHTRVLCQDTRGELGEWRVYMARDDAHVVIGLSPAFLAVGYRGQPKGRAGERSIIHTTLDATIDAAIALTETI